MNSLLNCSSQSARSGFLAATRETLMIAHKFYDNASFALHTQLETINISPSVMNRARSFL